MYTLETRQYHSIKLPFFNTFRRSGNDLCPELVRIQSYLSKLSFCTETFDDLISNFPLDANSLNQERQSLTELRQLAVQIRGTNDVFVYADAYIFGCGATYDTLRSRRQGVFTTLTISNFVLNIPMEQYEDMLDILNKDGFEFYLNCLPKTFDLWPRILSLTDISAAEKARYTHNACLLFAYIIKRAELSYRFSIDIEHCRLLRNQVLGYYKFLISNNIYLPRELQAEVAWFAEKTER